MLVTRLFKFEPHWNVRPKDAVLKTLNMTANIGLSVNQLSIVILLKFFLLLVRKDDIATKSLGHQ